MSPCEAYGAADAVFIGEARQPVIRAVPQPDGNVANVKFSPVEVEQSFRAALPTVVYLTPAGIETYLTPGQRYLVYGRQYAPPDMFMSADAYGTKLVADADRDLAFLDGANGGAIIAGTVEVDRSDVSHPGQKVSPLANASLELKADGRTFAARASSDGRFEVTDLPSGVYSADVELPPDLALDQATPPVRVLAGGCADMPLRVVPNGHVHGYVSSDDGRSAAGQSLELLVIDSNPGDHYWQSTLVEPDGRFGFDAVPPGRYRLGRLSFNLNGSSVVPSIYYPGTLDRSAAVVIVVEPGGTVDVGEMRIPGAR